MALPQSLDHESTVIVATDAAEFAYILKWCEMQGKMPPWIGDRQTFPVCIGVAGDLPCWTDRMDRALYYKPFAEFLQDIGRV